MLFRGMSLKWMPQPPRRTLWTPGCDNSRSVGGCTAWKGPQWQVAVGAWLLEMRCAAIANELEMLGSDDHVPRTELLVARASKQKL